MWQNYLTVCVRSLTRNRTYAFINIFGLTVGLAACLLVFLYIRYEQSYDSWLADADRTFQLQQWNLATEDNLYPGGMQMTSYISGERLRQFPQVEQVVYVSHVEPVILQDGEGTLSENFAFVNGPLFDVLGVPFVRGNPRTALASPGSMVLTETEARRRFGTADVVGRTLAVVAGGKTTDYRIGGVVKDLPKNSHLALSVVARVDFEGLYGGQVPFLTEWMPKNGWVYARLKPGADDADIARQMPAWESRNIPDQIVGGERMNPGTNVDWRLVNVRDIHLGEAQDGSMRPGNDRGTIVALAAVGALILLLAVVNFVNLATARASLRAREVALRKTLGASRRQLIVQFLAESVLVTAFSMLLALALVELLLPSLNAFLDAEIPMRYTGGDGLLLPALGLVLLVGGAGGLYPALVLSGFRPATVLRANRSSADTVGSGRLRNVLVVGQFAVSIGLIICTAIIYAQTAFARTVDPGYRRDGILQVGNLYRAALQPVLDTLLHEASGITGVSSVGRSTIGVATWGMENMAVRAPGAAEGVEFELYRVDPGFFPTLGIRTIAGRTFAENRAMDDSTIPDPTDEAVAAMARRGYNVVINELAARRLGFNRPEQAVGKTLLADYGDVETVGPTPATVIGVVGNSRFRSIRDPVQPMIFLYDRFQPSYLLIRYSGNPAEMRARMETVWKRIAPEVPFEAEFSEQIVQQLYDPEEARGIVFAAFAVLAIIVACLGLFGLAAFVAERRTKEIGIRKVFGATVRDIVKLLTWQFSKPVVLANLIAWPVAWWVMRDWLNGFDVRIQLGLEPFILAGFIAIVIAIGTVGGHAIRVARTNPIHALRYE